MEHESEPAEARPDSRLGRAEGPAYDLETRLVTGSPRPFGAAHGDKAGDGRGGIAGSAPADERAARRRRERRRSETGPGLAQSLASARVGTRSSLDARGLLAAISRLQPEARLALRRRLIERRSAREVAELLGKSEEAVRRAELRSLVRLRRELLGAGWESASAKLRPAKARGATRRAALLLDRAVDEARPSDFDAGHQELAGLLEVAALLRDNPQWAGAPLEAELAAQVTGRPSRRWQVASLAAGGLLCVAVTAGVVASRLTTSHRTEAAARLAACLNQARLVGPETNSLPRPALGALINEARQYKDPCPTRPVRWVKLSAGSAGLPVTQKARGGYAFELTGRFQPNPLRPGHLQRHIWLYWTAGAGAGSGEPIDLGRHGAHRALLVPARVARLPWAVARQLAGIGANSPIRYAAFRLSRVRKLTGTSLWPRLSGSRTAYLLYALVGNRLAGWVYWIAARTTHGISLDRHAAAGSVLRLLERRTRLFWLPPRLPAGLPRQLSTDMRARLAGAMAGRRALAVRWAATTVGHLESLDPYQEAVPEATPRNTVLIIASAGRSGAWFIATRRGGQLHLHTISGSPFAGLRLRSIGRLHRVYLRPAGG